MKLEVVDADNAKEVKEIEPSSGEEDWISVLDDVERPLYLTNTDLNFWYEYVEDENLLYFQYNRCVDAQNVDGTGSSFDQVTEEMIELAQDVQVDAFVIDLRFNIGGNSAVAQHFFTRTLLAGRVRDVRGNNLAGDDTLFGIIGRRTISSGRIHVRDLKLKNDAIMFGKPTGGWVNAFGDVNHFELPNTGLTVSHSTRVISTWPHSSRKQLEEEYRRPYEPHHHVDLTFTDYLKGRDPVLEAILEYIGKDAGS